MYKALIWLVIPCLIFSQNERKQINGAIQFDYGKGLYSNIVITNLNSNISTTTNILGQFRINAKEGDLLSINAPHIYSDEAEINAIHIKNAEILIIIEPIYYTLSDVNAHPFKITGNLEYDSKRIKKVDSLALLLKKLNIPAPRPRNEWDYLNKPIVSSLTSLDIDALYDVLSGKKKRNIALYVYEQKNILLNKIKTYFTEEYFTQKLKIPAEEIYPFIYMVSEIEDLETLYYSGSFYTISVLFSTYVGEYLQRLSERTSHE